MNKVKLISHTDLDGVGCVIVGLKAFGENLDYEMLNYNQINERIEDFVKSNEYKNYDELYITDISFLERIGELLEGIKEEINIKLLDHHEDALNLLKFDFCDVSPVGLRGKNSGTNLFYEFLIDKGYEINVLYEFVEKVRIYDTWEWKEIYNDLEAKKLNDYYYLIGRERFINRYLNTPSPLFSEKENMLMEFEYERMNGYVKWKLENVKVIEFEGEKIGVVFNEQYPNEVASAILESELGINFVALVNGVSGGVSVRSSVDGANKIANHFDGGGNPRTSGFGIGDEKIKRMLEIVFEK